MSAQLPAKPDFPLLEEEILAVWDENKTFAKSLAQREGKVKWTFLDGPPFVTGLPHYGHLLTSIPKDVFPRFWTMKGYHVRRVWGWDCHGLPAENKVENKLGIKRKRDIEEVVGMKKFIDECKLYVSEVSSEWKWYVDRIARWVDFDNSYRTMDEDYMETVMWVFKSMYDKGHIYKGRRVSLYCPHCATPISNFEVAMDADNYKDVSDTGTVYKYKLKNDPAYILSWSTTPWNKIVTPALAINSTLPYVRVENNGEEYVLAEARLEILQGDYKVKEKLSGKEVLAMTFETHYDFYLKNTDKKFGVIVDGDFVTAEDGTGVVTLAAYGEDDMKAMQKNDVVIHLHVNEEGMIDKDVPLFGGMYYLKANKAVDADLTGRGMTYRQDPYVHSMPHCWRCSTQLYYAPQDAWYVNIQDMKPRLYKNNESINWYPDHFKFGRFQKSMESAPDWCISRSRYWGSPVPVWECECGWRFVAGSIAELEEASGQKVTDLHRPTIDGVTVPCSECGKTAHRVPEVLDSWIEAGSASFAERHFPFDKTVKLDDFFPPDFIVEYTGQIRAWFYVLHVIATALYDRPAFKNVQVTGVILGTDGRKMSKNFGNYPDPKGLLEKYGGDALRLYLLSSPIIRGEDIAVSEDEYRGQLRLFHLPVWNILNFFMLYAGVDGVTLDEIRAYDVKSSTDHGANANSVLDSWLDGLTRSCQVKVTDALEHYDTVEVVKLYIAYINDVSNWYIRRSRDRVGDGGVEIDMEFYASLYKALTQFALMTAPVTPFLSEYIYRFLTGEESVHLQDWPMMTVTDTDTALMHDMEIVRACAERGHSVRKESQIKVRQPLSVCTFTLPQDMAFAQPEMVAHYETILADELNVKMVVCQMSETSSVGDKNETKEIVADLDLTVTPELQREGEARELVRSIQSERKNQGLSHQDRVETTVPTIPEGFADYIKDRSGTVSLSIGPFEVKKVS